MTAITLTKASRRAEETGDLYEGTCRKPYSRTMREALSQRNMKEVREASQDMERTCPIEQGKLEEFREGVRSSLAFVEANGRQAMMKIYVERLIAAPLGSTTRRIGGQHCRERGVPTLYSGGVKVSKRIRYRGASDRRQEVQWRMTER